jgi:hypothetical protein
MFLFFPKNVLFFLGDLKGVGTGEEYARNERQNF